MKRYFVSQVSDQRQALFTLHKVSLIGMIIALMWFTGALFDILQSQPADLFGLVVGPLITVYFFGISRAARSRLKVIRGGKQ